MNGLGKRLTENGLTKRLMGDNKIGDDDSVNTP